MKARPLGNYVAVCPNGQNIGHALPSVGGIIMSIETRTHRNFISGVVLSVGSKVPLDVSVGDTVVYEAQSAHQSQTAPIDAECFGGQKGYDAYLIPVYSGALVSSADLEEQLVRHQAEIEALSIKFEKGWLEPLDVERLGFHERSIAMLTEQRRGRSRNGERRKKGDTAKASGVVAIIKQEEKECQ